MTDYPDDDNEWDGPSKTQLKKAAHALQDLGEHLTGLSDQQLASLPLAEELLAEIKKARPMKANSARKRQIQYIGKLIRQGDSDAIQAALEQQQEDNQLNHHLLQLCDQWCHRLINDEAALQPFLEQYFEADRQQLRSLLRNCQKLPPETEIAPAHKKLRQWLRQCIQQHGGA